MMINIVSDNTYIILVALLQLLIITLSLIRPTIITNTVE
jgi:hypothetical protein